MSFLSSITQPALLYHLLVHRVLVPEFPFTDASFRILNHYIQSPSGPFYPRSCQKFSFSQTAINRINQHQLPVSLDWRSPEKPQGLQLHKWAGIFKLTTLNWLQFLTNRHLFVLIAVHPRQLPCCVESPRGGPWDPSSSP